MKHSSTQIREQYTEFLEIKECENMDISNAEINRVKRTG
jgi:hypothetical protein